MGTILKYQFKRSGQSTITITVTANNDAVPIVNQPVNSPISYNGWNIANSACCFLAYSYKDFLTLFVMDRSCTLTYKWTGPFTASYTRTTDKSNGGHYAWLTNSNINGANYCYTDKQNESGLDTDYTIVENPYNIPLFTNRADFKSAIETYTQPAITSNGGGATHIAKVTGQLSSLSNNLSDILIVSGGGGGGVIIGEDTYAGKDAGGIAGNGNNSANQTTGYAFGQGESGDGVSGGGGGLYGGYKGGTS